MGEAQHVKVWLRAHVRSHTIIVLARQWFSHPGFHSSKPMELTNFIVDTFFLHVFQAFKYVSWNLGESRAGIMGYFEPVFVKWVMSFQLWFENNVISYNVEQYLSFGYFKSFELMLAWLLCLKTFRNVTFRVSALAGCDTRPISL